ncbi:Conserved_hypothetical protein [Hexamita inflata]|uniref:Uncharacterized protein n=1 Tax=Hexamita inflata TaxID=28002 RepID=A0AA86PWB9_9EUKA|nr:Conserved hypothetical protein [Hexamita inflata]
MQQQQYQQSLDDRSVFQQLQAEIGQVAQKDLDVYYIAPNKRTYSEVYIQPVSEFLSDAQKQHDVLSDMITRMSDHLAIIAGCNHRNIEQQQMIDEIENRIEATEREATAAILDCTRFRTLQNSIFNANYTTISPSFQALVFEINNRLLAEDFKCTSPGCVNIFCTKNGSTQLQKSFLIQNLQENVCSLSFDSVLCVQFTDLFGITVEIQLCAFLNDKFEQKLTESSLEDIKQKQKVILHLLEGIEHELCQNLRDMSELALHSHEGLGIAPAADKQTKKKYAGILDTQFKEQDNFALIPETYIKNFYDHRQDLGVIQSKRNMIAKENADIVQQQQHIQRERNAFAALYDVELQKLQVVNCQADDIKANEAVEKRK